MSKQVVLKKVKKLIHLSLFKNRFKTPPILIYFVTSACNSNCSHCFYRNNLNQKNDLPLKTIEKISQSMGKVYQLLLSGGEPFLRKDLDQICRIFYQNNQLEELQIPTNSLLPEKINETARSILGKCPGIQFNLNLSLDGTEKIHDQSRGVKGNFKKVLENYRNLVKLKKTFPNLLINNTSTVTKKNIDDLFDLVDWVKKEMPHITHHYLGYERGRYWGDEVKLPSFKLLAKVNRKIEKAYRNKEGFVYHLLIKKIHQTKLAILKEKKQIVPCLAGRLVGVIYEDGQVANCEMLPPIGRIKQEGSFLSVWQNEKGRKQRQEIIKKQKCHCTHECFLSPSVLYGSSFCHEKR